MKKKTEFKIEMDKKAPLLAVCDDKGNELLSVRCPKCQGNLRKEV